MPAVISAGASNEKSLACTVTTAGVGSFGAPAGVTDAESLALSLVAHARAPTVSAAAMKRLRKLTDSSKGDETALRKRETECRNVPGASPADGDTLSEPPPAPKLSHPRPSDR